jgi:uncharacterized membrane protein
VPKATLAGHPAHPQLVSIPIALVPFALALDVLHLATGERSYAAAARYALTGATAGAAAAAVTGALDYGAIPDGHPAKRMARLHGAINVGVLGLTALNVALRRGPRPARGTTALSAVGTVALLASAWYGGHLVFEHGLRVRGRSPLADAPELALPGDRAVPRLLQGLLGRTRGRRPQARATGAAGSFG